MSELNHAPINKFFRREAYNIALFSSNAEKYKNLYADDVLTWIEWGGVCNIDGFDYLIDLAQSLADTHYSSNEWKTKASDFLMRHGQRVFEALEYMDEDSSGMYKETFLSFKEFYKK